MRKPNYNTSGLKSIEKLEGEPIEHKIERVLSNNEAITDGAPEIYTERKDGVQSAYNIRTDRWEIATEGMDAVAKSIEAKREGRAKKKEEAKVIPLKDGEAKSIEGTNDGK